MFVKNTSDLSNSLMFLILKNKLLRNLSFEEISFEENGKNCLNFLKFLVGRFSVSERQLVLCVC